MFETRDLIVSPSEAFDISVVFRLIFFLNLAAQLRLVFTFKFDTTTESETRRIRLLAHR
jgi:hypothetical protein